MACFLCRFSENIINAVLVIKKETLNVKNGYKILLLKIYLSTKFFPASFKYIFMNLVLRKTRILNSFPLHYDGYSTIKDFA